MEPAILQRRDQHLWRHRAVGPRSLARGSRGGLPFHRAHAIKASIQRAARQLRNSRSGPHDCSAIHSAVLEAISNTIVILRFFALAQDDKLFGGMRSLVGNPRPWRGSRAKRKPVTVSIATFFPSARY